MNPTDRRTEAAQWALRVSSGEADEQALQAWLEAGTENRRAYQELNAALQEVDRFAGAPEMVGLRGEALVLAQRSHDRLRRKAPSSWKLDIAAGLAFFALAAGILGIVGRHVDSHAFETGIGERRTLALGDGSRISLDAVTQVKVDYSTERRRLVLEHGRAKFQVAKDPLRPFTVEAGGRVVVATGTSFSVELLKKQLHVVLFEGQVEVVQAVEREREKPAHWTLKPGHELVVSGSSTQVVAVEPVRAASWESGELAFTEEPLSFAVERINRYAREKVSIGDVHAGAVRISGVFHAGDTDAFVDGVTSLFPVRAQRAEEGVVLLSREKSGR